MIPDNISILALPGDEHPLLVGKQNRCVFCEHQWFHAFVRGKMKARNCEVGHHPRLYPESPEDPRWVEYRRICSDFLLHKERKLRKKK